MARPIGKGSMNVIAALRSGLSSISLRTIQNISEQKASEDFGGVFFADGALISQLIIQLAVRNNES